MDSLLIWIILITMAVNCSFSLLSPFYPNVAKDYGVKDWMIGLVISSFSIAQILTSYVVGRTLEYVGRRKYLIIGLFGCSMTITAFGCLKYINPDKKLLFVIISIACRLANGCFGMMINVSNYSMIALKYPDSIM